VISTGWVTPLDVSQVTAQKSTSASSPKGLTVQFPLVDPPNGG